MVKIPMISVIVTAHNYGKYLPQCLDSVLRQRFSDWELIVVNDNSTDDTPAILDRYRMSYPESITVINLDGAGLAKACNTGIRASRGKFIIRLDADDYFDENILLVESNILENNPGIHMVYCDYYRISKYGEILDSYRLPKVNDEVKLLDRSPLAAGALYRRECYEAIGGYNEELRYQEDYDFWIRFIDKFNVYNVNLPLLYYRKHDKSMSTNLAPRMKARRHVKNKFVEEKGHSRDIKKYAVIPAMGLFRNREKLSLKKLNGRPLLAYTIEAALRTGLIDRVIVSTEDHEIAETAVQYGAEVPFLRPLSLSKTRVPVDDVLRHIIGTLRERGEEVPDIMVVLPYITPFRKSEHITEAINTILLYNSDSVISVIEDLSFHWKPGTHGLTPVGYQKRFLREDKETVYKENGAIYVLRSSIVESGGYLGKVIGHVEMSKEEAWRIETDFDFEVAKHVMNGGELGK